MTIRFVLPALLAALLAPTASADKFYLGSAATAELMTEGTPDFVEGVLLGEEDGMYIIRMEGGELRVAKDSVWKIESDALSANDVEQREKAGIERLAQANARRSLILGAAAEARMARIREVRAVEAAVRRESEVAEQARFEAASYDPILHTAIDYGIGGMVGDTVRRELGGVIRPALERELRDVRVDLRNALRR